MEAFFSRLYLDMVERLSKEVPELQWIEQDFGQDQADMRPNVAFPAALIDFPDTEYTDMGELAQLGLTRVRVRLLVDTFSQSYSAAPKDVKELALGYFELERRVVEALHGWQPLEGYCQPLVRKSAGSQNRNDIGLRIRSLEFDTMYEELFDVV